MQVAGAQPVGSRGLSGLQVVVSDPPAPVGKADARAAAPRSFVATPTLMTAEPVVFPRGGLPLDPRPVQLRRRTAEKRYREAAGLPTRRRSRNPPTH